MRRCQFSYKARQLLEVFKFMKLTLETNFCFLLATEKNQQVASFENHVLYQIWEKLQISFILLLFVFHFEQKREKKMLTKCEIFFFFFKFTNFLYVVIRGSFGTNQLLRIIYGCLILFHHWDQTKVNPRGQFHKYEHFRELQGKFEITGGQFAIDPNPKRCLCISAKVK